MGFLVRMCVSQWGCDWEERRGEEKQQRRSGVVLIRRLLQRCGLGRGARTSREKQHWRLRGLPSTATAYPRTPLSPSPWGTAGPQNIWENNPPCPTVATETLPISFFLSGETREGEEASVWFVFSSLTCCKLIRHVWYRTLHRTKASHPRECNGTGRKRRAYVCSVLLLHEKVI